MKKLLYLATAVIITITLCACGSGTSSRSEKKASAIDNIVSKQSSSDSIRPANNKIKASDKAYKSVDIDLTKLNSNMVYSEIYNMMNTPKNYTDKIIKINGVFSVYTDKNTGKRYFSCINMDATACCSQGIEFSLYGDYSFPDDYPNEGEKITVTGIFSLYKEGETTYCELKDAVMEQ